MNCKICNRQYSEIEYRPYTLIPCGHSFCIKCLEKLKMCPECDETIAGKLLNHAILEIINPNPLECNDGTIYFDRYKKICYLESGSYGNVYVFKDVLKEKIIALKTMQRYTLSDYVSEELNLLKRLKSPYIISFYDSFCQGDIFCILTEYCQGGNLAQRIRDKKRLKSKFDLTQIVQFSQDLINAVQYLHSNKIIHRDIKPGNAFLTEDGHIKLGDLGAARFVDKKYTDDMVSTYIGTLKYMSPEMKHHKKYTLSADIWSLGCVLFELITLEKFYDLIEPPRSSIKFYYCLRFRFKDYSIIFNKLHTLSSLKDILKMSLIEEFEQRSDSNELKRIISNIDSNDIQSFENSKEKRRKSWNLLLNFNDHSYSLTPN